MTEKRRGVTQSEIDFVLDSAGKMTRRQLAEALGRPYSTIEKIIITHGVRAKNSPTRPQGRAWQGCEKTCPDFCPYDDCLMPVQLAARNFEEEFFIKELLGN